MYECPCRTLPGRWPQPPIARHLLPYLAYSRYFSSRRSLFSCPTSFRLVHCPLLTIFSICFPFGTRSRSSRRRARNCPVVGWNGITIDPPPPPSQTASPRNEQHKRRGNDHPRKASAWGMRFLNVHYLFLDFILKNASGMLNYSLFSVSLYPIDSFIIVLWSSWNYNSILIV